MPPLPLTSKITVVGEPLDQVEDQQADGHDASRLLGSLRLSPVAADCPGRHRGDHDHADPDREAGADPPLDDYVR